MKANQLALAALRAIERPDTEHQGSAREIPGFAGATAWLNSPPLTAADLRGRTVLVDFWTYTCINWLRTLPYTRAWARRYQDDGLVVIGVHTPEFSFEHDRANVERAVRSMDIDYPVAIDSDYAIWDAFRNNYWPARYLVDAGGRIRHQHFGEGEYAESEMVIQRLLGEAGAPDIGRELAPVDGDGAEAAADWSSLWSPENYLGLIRTEHLASADAALPERPWDYPAPGRLELNQWAPSGSWTLGAEAAVANTAEARITCRFHARDLHLVMGAATPDRPVRFRVLIDDQPPGEAHGEDIDHMGYGTVDEPRLYQLIRQPPPIVDRRCAIEFLDPGVAAYAFTFG